MRVCVLGVQTTVVGMTLRTVMLIAAATPTSSGMIALRDFATTSSLSNFLGSPILDYGS